MSSLGSTSDELRIAATISACLFPRAMANAVVPSAASLSHRQPSVEESSSVNMFRSCLAAAVHNGFGSPSLQNVIFLLKLTL